MMAHSTHAASAPTGALPRSPQSPADAVAHRIALMQRLCTAGLETMLRALDALTFELCED